MATKKAPKIEQNHAVIPARVWDRYKAARKAAEQWAEAQKNARAEIEELLGDNEIGELEDGTAVVLWKTGKRTSLDQKLLAQLYPNVLEECKAISETRTFKLVDGALDD